MLRLWSAQPAQLLDLDRFNRGKFLEAAERRVVAETISRILYPNDSTPEGQELRLKQEYFFTSASLQDLVRRFAAEHGGLASLGEQVVIQLNDTHPAIAVPELILLLVDRHGMALDAEGGLVVAHPSTSVWRFDALGRPTHVVDAGDDIFCTNIAYGGADLRSLFVVVSRRSGRIDGGVILRADMPVPGKPMFSHAST